MLSTSPELIWEGKIHLGDEPGIFSDAQYAGISLELPVTLENTDPAGPDATKLVLHTKNAETFGGYPGHRITVTTYQPDPDDPSRAIETALLTERLTSADNNRKELLFNLTGITFPAFTSVQIRVDTEVPPGLYDDFVVTKLENQSANFVIVASFGFRS